MSNIIAQSRADLKWACQQDVDLNGHYDVYKNDGVGGAVDYNSKINSVPLPAWATGGAGKVDFDASPAVCGIGFGYGGFGLGPFGHGTPWGRFTTPLLIDGTWIFAVVSVDAAGNATTPATAEQSLTLAGIPDPPTNPQITQNGAAFDLSWTLSEDDN